MTYIVLIKEHPKHLLDLS